MDDNTPEKSKILIVDDTPKNIKVVGTILYEEGYDVSFAASGQEALDLIRQDPPDLILLDIMMADMDGYETCRRVKLNPLTSFIPIIFLSALAEPVDIAQGLSIGGVDYVTKPIKQEILKARVKTHLTISRLQRNLEEMVLQRTEELLQSEENLQVTLQSIGDGVITADKKCSITQINRVAQKLTGWKEEDALGHHISEIFIIRDAHTGKLLENPCPEVFQQRKVVRYPATIILESRKEDEYAITASAAPIQGTRGVIQGAVIVFRDETENVKREQQLLQAQKMEAVGTLAGGIAHDFNNVLSGIFGPVSLLEHWLDTHKKITPDELEDNISMIRQSSMRASEMVKQLLTLARKHKMEFSTIDLNASVQRVVKIIQKTFDKSIEIYITTHDTWAYTRADPTQIEQVLLNLCINASHAMTFMRGDSVPWGGVLEMSVSPVFGDKVLRSQFHEAREIGYWLISIKDTGIGIAKNDLDKIFTPFYTTKDESMGTGLGLSMVYNIIKQHGGFISVSSVQGIGTAFYLFFPQQTDNLDAHTHHEVRNIPKGQGTILIIEDEEILLRIGETLLEECGYKTITAKNGKQGIELYEAYKDKITGVLLDMVLPKKTGIEVFAELIKINPQVKVLLTSGMKSNKRVQSVLDMGAKGFIQKPYDLLGLAEAVKKYF